MDRRESIKSMLVGTLAGGAVITTAGCEPTPTAADFQVPESPAGEYGRTEKEKEIDRKLFEEVFFSDHELDTIATLCDLILPGTDGFKSAGEAEVPDFIAFIAKDMPRHQLPLRGGIMWLDNFANESFGKSFKLLMEDQQTSLLDQIAYPDEAAPEVSQGVKFFSLIRDLTLTGFYTSRIGIDELGYMGNSPNIWDGVPEEVLTKHGLSYEGKYLDQYVDQEKRDVPAEWDEDGNLIS